jgi:hypothetical protein
MMGMKEGCFIEMIARTDRFDGVMGYVRFKGGAQPQLGRAQPVARDVTLLQQATIRREQPAISIPTENATPENPSAPRIAGRVVSRDVTLADQKIRTENSDSMSFARIAVEQMLARAITRKGHPAIRPHPVAWQTRRLDVQSMNCIRHVSTITKDPPQPVVESH